MGAEVIRFDHLRGGPDYGRWPCTEDGVSLYWEGLNKGKKSIAIDLGQPQGRELAVQLATAPGEGRGMFVTNYPVGGFLSHDNLVKHRADLITVRVMGWADGATRRAHRWLWRIFRGPIPEGKVLLHECDNPSCVNLGHLGETAGQHELYGLM